jgi:DivIVA domain-containing protein
MEVTPQVFRDVKFREKMRGGYHPEDVDEFLEQAAMAVEALHEQIRQAEERAQRAEQAAADATATDEALKRMLVMAQRTADQAVHEAHEEADQLLADARGRAESLLADAEERGRRSYERGLAEARANLERAEEELRQAQREVEGVQAWLQTHKGLIVKALQEAQELVRSVGMVSEPPVTAARPEAVPAPMGEPVPVG